MKMLVAILMGLYCASIARDIVGRVFGSIDGRLSLPLAVDIIVFLVCAPAGTWLVLRNAPSWRRLIFNGCALGAVEWSLAIAASCIYGYRVHSAFVASGRSVESAASGPLAAVAAFFCLVVCVVGLLQTRDRPSAAPTVGSSSVVREREARPPREAAAPGTDSTTLIVASQVILAVLLIVGFIAARSINLGLAAILPALVLAVMACGLVVLAIAGMGQGVRLLKTQTHRVLGLIAVAVSAAPIVCAAILLAMGALDLRQRDDRFAGRREEYRQLEPFFRTPQVLKDSYATPHEIVLVFAGDRQIRMSAIAADLLSEFCDSTLVGKPLDVRMPPEGTFLWNHSVDNVLYEGKHLQKYWREHRPGG
jgi:hypothetical protein